MLAEGAYFRFFINDQFVAEASEWTLDSGRVGMAAGINEKDLNIVFEFDNLILLTP